MNLRVSTQVSLTTSANQDTLQVRRDARLDKEQSQINGRQLLNAQCGTASGDISDGTIGHTKEGRGCTPFLRMSACVLRRSTSDQKDEDPHESVRTPTMEARRCLFIDNRALVSFCAEYRFNSDVQIGTKIRLQWAMLAANVLGSWQLGAIISLITGF
ncbi:hypothetical protein BC629DRAFT_1442090 [Irpex lacteus]|nr:hypothetical protein BC629DRAFT_1442090 [Irpex lacteus]